MGVLVERFADDRGLVWPEGIAPYQVYIASLGIDPTVVEAAENLYKNLTNAGIEVIWDDRDVRPGEKFADADLMGIPYRVVVSQKTLANEQYELKRRTEETAQFLDLESVIKIVAQQATKLL
jgi:prolyl-tRNA synthetase